MDKKKTNENILEDFDSKPVPIEQRKGWLSLTFVWIGGIISLSATALGGQLGMGMPMNEALIATIVGSFILAIMSVLACIVGANTGLSTSRVSSFALGKKGAILVSLVIAISLFGWFGVQLDLFGQTLHQAIKSAFGLEINTTILSIIGGALMTITAMYGYKAIDKLSVVAVPLLAILLFASLFVIIKDNGLSFINSTELTADRIPLSVAISSIIGSLAVGTIIGPDFSRYAKKTSDAIISSLLGFLVGTSVVLAIAAILAKATASSDIISIFITLGWGMGAMVVLILAQWTTNNTNIYSSALSFSSIFTNIPRYVWTVLAGISGTIIGIFGIYNHFIQFLIFLSMLIPPIGGIYVADYFTKKELYNFENINKIKDIRYESLATWIISSIIAYMSSPKPSGAGILTLTGTAGLDAFIAALIIQVILNKTLKHNADF